MVAEAEGRTQESSREALLPMEVLVVVGFFVCS